MTRADHSLMQLREMAERDLDTVAALESAVSAHPWSLELFAGEFELPQDQRLWLVADLGGVVCGFAGVMFVAEDVHLMNIAVNPSHRRQGIGQVLLGRILIAARDRGARHLTLEVRPSNTAALAMYRHFRLGPVGVREAYYSDGENALIMWAHDIDSADYGRLLERLTAAAGAPS